MNVLLSPEKIARLEKNHWAGDFRRKALPVLLTNENTFRPLFCPAWGCRTVTLTWLPSAGATSARRGRERTKEFKDGYRLRSGIEATNSEYKRP